ncbi:putative methyltransferase-domain-containing protein [Spinellus fusiger]|nr:putative methyltransferase-domain-containing protein [Spinellus fusiger]
MAIALPECQNVQVQAVGYKDWQEDTICQALYQHSTFYRIVLSRPYTVPIVLGHWYRMDLALVNEFGLPLQGSTTPICSMTLTCELLYQDTHAVWRKDTRFDILLRPLPRDAWETNSCDWPGFSGTGKGGFEYKTLARTTADLFCVIQEGWEAGTPGKVWDSALVLADLIATQLHQEPTYLENLHVVDLSAGTGCLGLALSCLCRALGCRPLVTMTDLPEALPLIRYNTHLNTLGESRSLVHVQSLQWGNEEEARRVTARAPVDILLASDVLYVPQCFDQLIRTLLDLCTVNRTVVYLGYKRRGLRVEEEARFFHRCSRFFHVSLTQDSLGQNKSSPCPSVHWEQKYGRLGPIVKWFSKDVPSYCNVTHSGVRVYRLVKRAL